MIQVEELVDVILAEEGQTLMGLEFLTEALGLTMDEIDTIFVKTVQEYEMRRPFYVTEFMNTNPLILPKNTINVRAIRYGILEEVARTLFPTYGEPNYEVVVDYSTGQRMVKVKTWPPIYPVRVTYSRGYTISRKNKVYETYEMVEGENEIDVKLKGTFRPGTLSITKGNSTISIAEKKEEVILNTDGDEILTEVCYLEGSLGTGKYIPMTRKLHIDLEDTSEGDLSVQYYPKYSSVLEIEMRDYAFTKFFASKLLEALASLRAQATQEDLHHIDLTTDDLYARVRILKNEVARLLRTTFAYGDLAEI